jgi:transcriptional regulator with XRE-family HTH domain
MNRSTRRSLADRIIRSRRAERLTQKHVADRLGIAQSTYHDIEHEPDALPVRKLVHIANAIGVPPSDFGLRVSEAQAASMLKTPFVMGPTEERQQLEGHLRGPVPA